MKMRTLSFLLLLLTVLLICEQTGVSAKKQKGNHKSALKSKNNNEGNKEKYNKKAKDVASNEYTKEGKYDNTNTNKKQENYKNKPQINKQGYKTKAVNKNEVKNKYNNNNKNEVKNKYNNNNKKEYAQKNVKNERQTNEGEIKERIKREYTDKTMEKYSKTVKCKSCKSVDEPLNGAAVNENTEQKTLIQETQQEIENNLVENDENNGEIVEVNQEDNQVNAESCKKCNSQNAKEIQDQCTNKKLDSIERNTTKICEKYKSEKNTQVVEEKIISDHQNEIESQGEDLTPVVLEEQELLCDNVK